MWTAEYHGNVTAQAGKALAQFTADRAAHDLGIRKAEVEYDFSEVMARVQRVITTIEPHDSIERYESLGVDCVTGNAYIRSPWEVEVNGKTITTRNIVIATGARPTILDIPGINDVEPLTSDTIWGITKRPDRFLVLGSGAVGCELGQCFARLGSDVTMVFRGPHVLSREDQEAAVAVESRLKQDGIKLCSGHTPVRFEKSDDGYVLICRHNNQEKRIGFDKVLLATGRTANVTGFGLEQLGIINNETWSTSSPSIRPCKTGSIKTSCLPVQRLC